MEDKLTKPKPKFATGDRVIGTKARSKYASEYLFLVGEIKYLKGKFYYSAPPLEGWKAEDKYYIEQHKNVENIPENKLMLDNEYLKTHI